MALIRSVCSLIFTDFTSFDLFIKRERIGGKEGGGRKKESESVEKDGERLKDWERKGEKERVEKKERKCVSEREGGGDLIV